MGIHAHPTYQHFFAGNGRDWENFQKIHRGEIDLSQPDFVVETRTWMDTMKKIALWVLKVILFPWAIYDLSRALFDRLAMLAIYPAQITSTIRLDQVLGPQNPYDRERQIVREIVLQKDGTTYAGLLVGTENTINNGKWALFGTGNMESAEKVYACREADSFLKAGLAAGYNVLIVNPPGGGRSPGFATADSLGEAQDVALTYLEEAIKAQKIVIGGQSLGGGAAGLGILKHQFNPLVQYFSIRYMTFDSLSHVVGEVVSDHVKFPFRYLSLDFLGDVIGEVAKMIATFAIQFFQMEIDSVAASKKLQELNIHEVVIRGERDELMDNCSLVTALWNRGILENKTLYVEGIGHNYFPQETIERVIPQWDQAHPPILAV